MVFWFFGFPGTGKDYCAKILTNQIKASYLHMDDILTRQDRKKLLDGTFTSDDRIRKLERAVTKIKELLTKNNNVVAADSLPDHRSRKFLLENFKDNIIFIQVLVSPEIHKKRLLQRKDHFFTQQLLDNWVKTHWQEPIKIPHVVLDNNIEGEKHVIGTLKEML